MGLMMILVAQLEGLDGVVSAEPSQYGIVLEVEHTDELDEWLDEHPYQTHHDVAEHEEELRKSNKHIPFASPNQLIRITREPTE